MRLLAIFPLLAAAVSPVAAQAPSGAPALTLEALRRDFPVEHRKIAESLAGKPAVEARRLAYAGIDRFLRERRAAVLAAPGPVVVALEARQGALLRTLGRLDSGHCASVGDRGAFSEAGAAAPPFAGLDDYGVALVAAAKAGTGAATPPAPATAEDFEAWLKAVARIEPGVPVRDMLFDREIRAKASPDHLCRGAAAMHEAVAALPPGQRERIARTLLNSLLAPR